MKKLTSSVIVFSIAGLVACENEEELSASEVPHAVVNAFQLKYPGIAAEKWVKEHENDKAVYEVEFINNGKEVEAEFDEGGNFIEEE